MANLTEAEREQLLLWEFFSRLAVLTFLPLEISLALLTFHFFMVEEKADIIGFFFLGEEREKNQKRKFVHLLYGKGWTSEAPQSAPTFLSIRVTAYC